MEAIYILGTVTVLAVNLDRLLPTLQLVFSSAFSQTAAVGGFAGATIQMAIQNGVKREFSPMNLVWDQPPLQRQQLGPRNR